jgi:phosphoribosylamine---glycine ligase
MKTIIAVIDAGGRGSALIDKYSQSKHVDELIAIPGNDLMQINTTKPVHIFPHLKTTSKDEILEICKQFKVSLVDVSQDNAIEAGVSDLLRENEFKVVGPSRLAGQLEWDKTFSRELLLQTRALQPEYVVFDSEDDGIKYIKSQIDKPRFIKAFGLAEGKGALSAKDKKEAIERIKELKKFGEGGRKYLIEDWLIGEEFSAFSICDGVNYQFLGFAQDHKRALDGDKGENTGGMGCSTPPLVVTKDVARKANETIAETLDALKSVNRPFAGIIYFGGIVVQQDGENKVYVIEFNARWGDPEVECILPGIKNDWYEVGIACAEGKLNTIKIRHDGRYRIVVAVASRGYPTDYSKVKGRKIEGFDDLIKTPGIKIYGAGVKKAGGDLTANGGRLFYVVAEGKNVIDARENVYSALKKVSIKGDKKGENLLRYRTDIGYRDVTRLKK